jgi:hypothetical protein
MTYQKITLSYTVFNNNTRQAEPDESDLLIYLNERKEQTNHLSHLGE